MNWKRYRPSGAEVDAILVTPENYREVVRTLGGMVETSPKTSDPSDVATWITIPTLNGPKRLLIPSVGLMVAKDSGNGQLLFWGNPDDFLSRYTAYDTDRPVHPAPTPREPRF